MSAEQSDFTSRKSPMPHAVLFYPLPPVCNLWLDSPVTYEPPSSVSAIQMIAITLSSQPEASSCHTSQNFTDCWCVSTTRSEFPTDMTPTQASLNFPHFSYFAHVLKDRSRCYPPVFSSSYKPLARTVLPLARTLAFVDLRHVSQKSLIRSLRLRSPIPHRQRRGREY